MDLVLAAVVLVLEPLPVLDVVLELPEDVLKPEVVPVEAVVLPEVVDAVVVLPEVELAEVVVVPVRSTEPVAVPEDAETLVEEVDGLSLELPPIEPHALRASVQARDTARKENDCASA